MPLKKVTIALCSCHSSRFAAGPALPSFTSSSSASHSRPSSLSCRPSTQRKLQYATVNHNKPSDSPSNDHKIPHWPKSANPTPYEIFDIPKAQPYTKKRFYQLVKLYHPDRHHHDTPFSSLHRALPHTTRLERYRLVVAANDLLSDPSKRSLYDNHGMGWTGDGRAQSLNETMRAADRSWRDQDGNAAHNATWEDWERWHDARDGTVRRGPPLMGNGTFAMLVVMMCMVGALAQRTRAEASGAEYVEWTAKSNGQIGEEMKRRATAKAGASPQERVEVFLRDRENVAYQYVPTRYDGPPRQERPPSTR